MDYDKAIKIAEKVKELLAPHCHRIAIAGSLRREKIWVKDIEILAIAKPYDHGVFTDGLGEVVKRWPKITGKMIYGKVKNTRRILPAGIIEGSEPIVLDLYFAQPDNWGRILASRTGPANFSHKTLAIGWNKAGYESINNRLYKGELRVDVPEEEDLFKLIGIPYVEPKHRT